MNRQARGGGNSNCRWAGILIVADHLPTSSRGPWFTPFASSCPLLSWPRRRSAFGVVTRGLVCWMSSADSTNRLPTAAA